MSEPHADRSTHAVGTRHGLSQQWPGTSTVQTLGILVTNTGWVLVTNTVQMPGIWASQKHHSGPRDTDHKCHLDPKALVMGTVQDPRTWARG